MSVQMLDLLGISKSCYNSGMSPEQCRAARAWLDWPQRLLASKAKVSTSTILDFESGRRIPHANNLDAIRRVLEDAGMQFHCADDGTPLCVGVAPMGCEKVSG